MAFPGDEDLKGSQKAEFRRRKAALPAPLQPASQCVEGPHWGFVPWVGVCPADDHDSDCGQILAFPRDSVSSAVRGRTTSPCGVPGRDNTGGLCRAKSAISVLTASQGLGTLTGSHVVTFSECRGGKGPQKGYKGYLAPHFKNVGTVNILFPQPLEG